MKILDFAFILGKLKKLERTGWVKAGVPQPESVAEHSFRLAVLAMFLAPKIGVDVNKSIQMALLHDIGEAGIGDIITSRGKRILKNLSSKVKLERESLRNILSFTDKKDYLDLFDEYEANQTKEAKFIRELDKLEMAIQAYEYEKGTNINLSEFFENASLTIKSDYLNKILLELKLLRK